MKILTYSAILVTIIFLAITVSAISYLDAGTKIISQNVTYTLINRINLTGISVFSSTSNYINLDGKYIFNFTSNASNNDLDLITLSQDEYVFNVSCSDCVYNVTIKNISMTSVKVTRDGAVIPNWTLSGDDLTIHGWSNSENQYSIQESMFFHPPTPGNNSYIPKNYTQINISVTTANLDSFKFNWNGTNYTFYDDSLVLALNFNNNSAIGESSTLAVDISKYGNNGTIHGATWTTGKFGKALSFDGSDDYVDCENDESLNITDEITIEAWIKREGSGEYTIASKYQPSGDNRCWLLRLNSNNKLIFAISPDGTLNSVVTLTSATVIGTDWTHMVGVRDNTNMRVFINGVQDPNTKTVSGIYGGDAHTNIGRWITAHYFNGTIDEVRIYNRALTPEEIRMHYLSEFQKYNSTQYRFYNNITDLTDGTYTYYGWANDTAGNEGSTETRTLGIGEDGLCKTHYADFIIAGNFSVLGDCITIGADNVDIQGEGNSLIGDSSGVGINCTDYNNLTIDNLTVNKFEYDILIYNSSGFKYSGIKIFDFHAYNSSPVEIDIPETNCRYGFKDARITDADWTNCNFNLTLDSGRYVHVESYEAKGIPTSIIIAFGAAGLSILILIWRRRRGRR